MSCTGRGWPLPRQGERRFALTALGMLLHCTGDFPSFFLFHQTTANELPESAACRLSTRPSRSPLTDERTNFSSWEKQARKSYLRDLSLQQNDCEEQHKSDSDSPGSGWYRDARESNKSRYSLSPQRTLTSPSGLRWHSVRSKWCLVSISRDEKDFFSSILSVDKERRFPLRLP